LIPDLQAATQGRPRVAAGPHRRTARALLLVAGGMSILTGLALLLTTFAPLFVPRSDSATVVAPVEAPADDDLGPSTAVTPSPPAAASKPAVVAPRVVGPIDGYSFELRIPVIGYSGLVHQGVGAGVLANGPGHYPTTPWPGSRGNIGVAAHNVYWLSFNRLKVGDRVQIVTQHGLFVYQITASWVTSPSDRTVLVPTTDNRLTLTTCYRFGPGLSPPIASSSPLAPWQESPSHTSTPLDQSPVPGEECWDLADRQERRLASVQFDGDVAVAVGPDHPRRRDVVVRAKDVCLVVGAGHEQVVDRGVVDPS